MLTTYLTPQELASGHLTTDRLTDLVHVATRGSSYFDVDDDDDDQHQLVVLLELPGPLQLRIRQAADGWAWREGLGADLIADTLTLDRLLFNITFALDGQDDYLESIELPEPLPGATIIRINPLLHMRRAA